MAVDVKKKLGAIRDNWATNRDRGYGSVPDGRYTMQLQSARVGEAESSGKLYIRREHIVIEGDETGSVVSDFMSLSTDQGPRFVMQWIEQMGKEVPDDPEDLPDVIDEISEAHPIYTGSVSTNKDGFTNVRVNRLLEEGADQEIEAKTSGKDEEEEEEDDPKPKGRKKTTSKKSPTDQPEGVRPGARVSALFDDEPYEGEVEGVDVEAGTADVKFDDGSEETMEISELTLLDVGTGEGGGKKEEEALEELIAFCQTQEIDVDDDDTEKTLIKKIKEYEWDRKELVDDEIELLESIDAVIKGKKKTTKKGKK